MALDNTRTVRYTLAIATGRFHEAPLPQFLAGYRALSAVGAPLCQVFADHEVIRPVFDIDSSHATEAEMQAAAARIAEELVPAFMARHFPGARYNLLSSLGRSNDQRKRERPWKASFHLYGEGVTTTGADLKRLLAREGNEGLGAYLDASLYVGGEGKKLRCLWGSKAGEDRPLVPWGGGPEDPAHYVAANVPVAGAPDAWPHVEFAAAPAAAADAAAERGNANAKPKTRGRPRRGEARNAPSAPSLADAVAPRTAAGGHTVRRLVRCLNADTAADRERWVAIGMALKHEGAVAGDPDLYFPEWHEFSALAAGRGYASEEDCRATWDALKPDGRANIDGLHTAACLDDPEAYAVIACEISRVTPEMVTACKRAFADFGGDTEDCLAHTHHACFPRFRYCGGRWYEYKAPRWEECCTQALNLSLLRDLYPVYEAAAATLRGGSGDAAAALLRCGKSLYTACGKDRVLKSLSNFAYERDFEKNLDGNPRLLAFEDGVWEWDADARSGGGRFREGAPEDLVTKSTGYPFPREPPTDAERAELAAFLDPIYCDPEVLRYVLAAFRKCLDGRAPRTDHQLFLLTGNGGGGKTALLAVLAAALGGFTCPELSYAYKMPASLICSSRAAHTAADEVLFRLKGMRLLVVAEPSGTSSETMNDAFVNELTGGEPITARPLYRSPQTFVPQGYLFIAANDCLNLDGSNSGIQRRFRCVRHGSRFVREGNLPPADPAQRVFLQDDAAFARAKELAPKLMWMVLHEPAYRNTAMPPAVREWSGRYLGDRDVFQAFVRDRLVRRDPEVFAVDMNTLKGVFFAYAKDAAPDLRMRVGDLKNKLAAILGECVPQKMIDGARYRNAFLGWQLTEE